MCRSCGTLWTLWLRFSLIFGAALGIDGTPNHRSNSPKFFFLFGVFFPAWEFCDGERRELVPKQPKLGSPALRLWALLAAQHTIFRREGPGVVYATILSSRADYDQFLNGTLTEAQYLCLSDVKFGHTNNLERRMRQYRPCNGNGHFVNWVFAYRVTERIRIERAAHLTLERLNLQLNKMDCPGGCGTKHKEYYLGRDIPTQSIGAIRNILEQYISRLGQYLPSSIVAPEREFPDRPFPICTAVIIGNLVPQYLPRSIVATQTPWELFLESIC
ncbi:hypothetical protein DFH07DRAFT_778929 [Mycena maculata]|uniref:Bacteriophage T5 Orf172 DNA-binding domain-containing protein n=1 Tax=Mycena maculata TaxID=230809 RepID=A0AAD7IAT9_9AGAR|nr:hypothetical protein DFH07DRAFT_778929 [Mycena maculata]